MNQSIIVLIVDDEGATRQILVKHIPWQQLGVEQVYSAENGMEGLKLARELKPHIIISDIKMPHMNGIEMAKAIRKEQPDNCFVFLSAYADKEYLKTAIQIKATNFIEKPIDLEDITKLMTELIQEIKIRVFKMETNLLEEQLMTKVTLNEEDFVKLVLEAKPSFASNLNYYIAAFKLHVAMPSNEYLAYQEILTYNFPKESCIKSMDRVGILFLIVKGGEKWSQFKEKIQSVVSQMVEINKEGLIFISIINQSVRLSDLQEACEFVREGINRCFFEKENQVYVIQAAQPAYEVEHELFDTFEHELKEGREHELMMLLHTLYNQFEHSNGTSINYVKNVYFKLIFYVLQEVESRMLSSKLERREIIHRLNQSETLYRTAGVVKETLRKFFEMVQRAPTEVDDPFYKMHQYLEEHYQEIEFSIKDMANYFNFTQCYLCVMYKKKTGITINQALTQLRIDKAKELLKNPKLKLYDIAYKVGYADGKYFTKVFSKVTGITPKQFRERHWAYEDEI